MQVSDTTVFFNGYYRVSLRRNEFQLSSPGYWGFWISRLFGGVCCTGLSISGATGQAHGLAHARAAAGGDGRRGQGRDVSRDEADGVALHRKGASLSFSSLLPPSPTPSPSPSPCLTLTPSPPLPTSLPLPRPHRSPLPLHGPAATFSNYVLINRCYDLRDLEL